MEWKKVKSILIALLLVLNVIVGADIVLKLEGRRTQETDSVRDAVALLEQEGVSVDAGLFLSLPVELSSYTAERDKALELKIAQSVLGESVEVQEPGGEIALYRSEKGEISFRSDGFFDMSFAADGQDDTRDYFSGLLRSSGFPMEYATEASQEDGDYRLVQRTPDGYSIMDAQAVCSLENGVARVSGEWVFGEQQAQAQTSYSRAELILALRQELSGWEEVQIEGVSVVYTVQATQTQKIELIPTWKVDCGEKTIYCNMMTKGILIS